MVPIQVVTTGKNKPSRVLNHYHNESKDCITELASLAYLMTGHCIVKLRNSFNNDVGKHVVIMFAI